MLICLQTAAGSVEEVVRPCTAGRSVASFLAGLKTGNLISVGYPDAESLYADIREMNRIFVRKGLCAVPLGYSSGRGLIYIYRTADLRRDLKSPEALRELPRMGYCCKSVGACVARLAERVRECSGCQACRAAGAQCSNPEDGGFPHEIGFFLGYPTWRRC